MSDTTFLPVTVYRQTASWQGADGSTLYSDLEDFTREAAEEKRRKFVKRHNLQFTEIKEFENTHYFTRGMIKDFLRWGTVTRDEVSHQEKRHGWTL